MALDWADYSGQKMVSLTEVSWAALMAFQTVVLSVVDLVGMWAMKMDYEKAE
jgi:hypothetical protein